jgi:hypothetical protein
MVDSDFANGTGSRGARWVTLKRAPTLVRAGRVRGRAGFMHAFAFEWNS